MKKYIVTNGKGLRFQDQGKDFQLKNNQEFDAKPTEYMAYLLKNKFIKEVEVKAEPVAEPKAEPAPKEVKPAVKNPAPKEAKPAAEPAEPAEQAAEPAPKSTESNKK
jgi:hypothetical protein